MLIIILSVLLVFLITTSFFFNKKDKGARYKTWTKGSKLVVVIILGIFVVVLVQTLMSDGIRFFYCFSNDKCITIWKRENREFLIIAGKYKSDKLPVDNYIKVANMNYRHAVILLDGSNLIVDLEDNVEVLLHSSNGTLSLYKNNQSLNDSLYTHFKGGYRRYKANVDYINVSIEENYATDKDNNKLN